MTISLPTLYTQDEAAKYLRVSSRTVRRLVADGRLRLVRIGSRALVSEKELHAFVAASYRKTR